MKVILQYFKPNGKWYSEGEYETSQETLWMIWNEVEEMQSKGKLPGLVDGAREFIISVDVPEHPHRHPHLIIRPEYYETEELCEVSGCHNIAEYEGWHRKKDFANLPTGLVQKLRVCEIHRILLVGAK